MNRTIFDDRSAVLYKHYALFSTVRFIFNRVFSILFPSTERLEDSEREAVVPCVRHKDIFLEETNLEWEA